MKKFRLLSFLCLLVIGWSNAWGATYPKTWDFTTSSSTEGLTITNTGQASNWVYVEGIGWTGQRGGDEAIITIPNVMYGNVITIYLSTGGTNPNNNNGQKSWSLSCGGINVNGNGGDVGTKAITIPATVTSLTDATISIRGYSAQSWLVLSRIEVTRSPITFNVDNGIYIDNPAEQYPNRVDYKTQLQNGDVTIPVYNENNAFWTIDPRFKINGEDNFNIDALCDGTFDPSYFEVTYNTAGILSNEAIRADRSTTVDGNTFNTRFRFRLSDMSRGTTSMTVTYKGSQGFEPFSKTINFNVEGINCQISDANINNVYEKYLDDGQWNVMFRLRDLNNNVLTFANNCTVKTIDDSGEEIVSNVITLGTPSITNNYLVIPISPNALGTATLRVDYPGDAAHEPTTYRFEVNIIQHMVKLEWVKTYLNNNQAVLTNEETDKWTTNQNNWFNGIPMLRMYIDNVEVNTADHLSELTFESNNTNVATINSNAGTSNHEYVNWVGAGLTVITARFKNSYKDINGIHYYYYSDAASSYTMILETVGSTDNDPHIIWVTAGRFGSEADPFKSGQLYNRNAAGSYLGQRWLVTASNGENEKKATDDSQLTDSERYPFARNFTGYGNNIFINAIALKKSVTDADLEALHIHKIPGYKDHYYVIDDKDEQWWTKGTWRSINPYIPTNYLFDSTDPYHNNIQYMVAQPEMVRATKNILGNGNNNFGETSCPTKTYKLTPKYPSKDSLEVYAYIEGYGTYSTTKLLVNPGNLQLAFIPSHGTVNADQSISPYVNCPDLRLEDVKKIWLTYDCPQTLNVPNNGVVYETGVTTHADIAKYLTVVTANDTIWKNVDAKNYNDDGTPILENIEELRPTTWLRGVNPEIFGLSTGINKSCTVTIHLESEMYETATAEYTLTVLERGSQPMFHWEMNDKIENGKHVDDGVMRTIKISQGDFVHMPGIVGNANGNKQYSQPNQDKYMYGIQNGVVIMNYKKYFPGEGIPNYYVSYTENGNPSVPVSNTTTNQPAIITWAIGLGDYWRNDSLMIYGNEPGVMYLYAQDSQTGQTCTPIKIVVLKSVGDEGDMLDQKHDALDDMSYPFTWDFEHIDMTEYIKDASNTTEGNGGTYWRKAWDENYPKDEEPIGKAYNRDYRHETDYYQYNGGFNADWDDKDGDKESRQRWFKDIHVNGKYAPEFKGIMLNLAGLQYWEQKYQRFLIHEDGDYISFKGGPIFIQLPGFGLLAKKGGIEDGTRAHDNYIGSTHNHINTAKYNVNEKYTKLLSVDNNHNVNIQYPVQTTNASGQARDYRNNKVRFVIKARGNKNRPFSDNETPNNNQSSQFHIGGASMINETLKINDINWTQPVHNGYSYYNIDGNEAKVYIVELDPYDPELQDHIYLMFNNDVDVYWMAITNEPRNILSDFDGVTYSYPKDIDMDKTNQTLAQQTKQGIYTKADENGNYALASVGEHTIKNVYQVGSDTPGEGTQLQLKAYKVSSFDPTNQSVSLTEIEGNIPQNEGVMLYTEPRMSALTANGGHIPGLTAEHYDRGATAYSKWVTRSKIVDGKTVYYDEEVFDVAPDSTYQNNKYNNSHNYYTFPLYFIAMAENMSEENYNRIRPTSTGSAVDPSIGPGHVVTENLLRPVTYGQVLPRDYTYQDTKLINFGYNNEFICRKLVYQDGTQTKEMNDEDLYVEGSGSNTHEDMYYYRIGIENAKFYRINTSNLNHHNRSAYLTLTWDEYKVNTVGKPINMGGSKSTDSSTGDPTAEGPNDPIPPKSPIRFSPSYNPVDIVFGVNEEEQFVSEDGGFPDGINEVEQNPTGDGKVYNLNGVPVNTLSKGVYIINGKKVVVK